MNAGRALWRRTASLTWIDRCEIFRVAGGQSHVAKPEDLERYTVSATDGGIGSVAKDFIVDDETWQVRYLVIDTSNWWFGKKVLVTPHWASRISWEERKVHVDLSRQAIENSPEWNASAAVNREYEARLYSTVLP